MSDFKNAYPCKDRVCSKCWLQPECAANSWCLFDRDNLGCPNREEGLKQWYEFLESEAYYGSSD